jgi:hypothetical protein
METLTIFLLFIVLIVVLLLIAWLVTKRRSNNYVNYNITHLIEGQQDATQYVVVDKNKIPLSVQGNEYSISMWIFIKDYNYRYGGKKVILYRGDKDNVESNPYIYLDSENNDLVVRVQTQSGTGRRMTKDKKDNKEYFGISNISGNSLDGEQYEHFQTTPTSRPATIGDITSRLDRIELQMQKITMTTPAGSKSSSSSNNDTDSSNQDVMYDECVIPNIPIQRWCHLVMSVYNNSIEVYLDGRLHKTCNLSGYAKPNLFNMHVTPNGGFNGFIAQLDYANAALPSDKIYNIYIKGPKVSQSFMDKISGFGDDVKNVITQ